MPQNRRMDAAEKSIINNNMKIQIQQGEYKAEYEIKKANFWNKTDRRFIEVVFKDDDSKGCFAAKDVTNLKELNLQ